MLEAFALYFVAINGVTFLAFAVDKRAAARRDWRVPERRLLSLAALGGSPAAFAAQRILRHKTRKEPFRTSLWLVGSGQVLGLACGAYLVM